MVKLLKAGRFIYNAATNSLEGPADYMADKGDAKVARMLAGTDAGFNALLACAPTGSDPVMILLVALQTDFAGWLGAKQLNFAALRGRI